MAFGLLSFVFVFIFYLPGGPGGASSPSCLPSPPSALFIKPASRRVPAPRFIRLTASDGSSVPPSVVGGGVPGGGGGGPGGPGGGQIEVIELDKISGLVVRTNVHARVYVHGMI